MLRLDLIKRNADWNAYDAILISGRENIYYVSGFNVTEHQAGETAGYLFLTGNKSFLLTDSRYEEQAKSEAPGFETLIYRQGADEILSGLIKDLSIKVFAYEPEYLFCSVFNKIRDKIGADVDFVPVSNLVEDIRMIKDKVEIGLITASLALTERVFQDTMHFIREGLTEKEVAWFIEKQIREEGAESLAFPPIVASGPNSAMPHAMPGERKIKAHEPVVIDMGSQLNGYCSDMTRTICLKEPTEEFRNVYARVRLAQDTGIRAVTPGVKSSEVDKAARDIIDESPFKGRFGHGLGHGVGLATHEAPSIGPNRSMELMPGMVITVEPGIYIPGWGGVRLENMVQVTENGCLILNRDKTFYEF